MRNFIWTLTDLGTPETWEAADGDRILVVTGDGDAWDASILTTTYSWTDGPDFTETLVGTFPTKAAAQYEAEALVRQEDAEQIRLDNMMARDF